MRIAVFGATGGTGRPLVERALELGHDLSALSRSAEPGLPDDVRLVIGDARDRDAVRTTLDDAGAVASVLGIQTGTEPTTALSDATRTIAEAMDERGLRRIVITTNSTVFSDREIKDPYRIIAEEHRRNVAMLRESDLDWTVLAPTLLRDGEPGPLEAVVDAKASGGEISRVALAFAVLEAFGRADWIRHVVGVADTLIEPSA